MTISNQNVEKPEAAKLLKAVTYAAVLTSLILALAKFYGWLQTDSISILGSLLDSFLDVTSAIIIAFAVRYSLQPADHDHRYGHGKAEPIAAFIQALFIAGSAVLLLIESCRRILYPAPLLMEAEVGVAVMAFSVLASLGLFAFQMMAWRRTGSMAVKANAMNYRMDVLTNLASFTAIGSAWFYDAQSVDALAGAGIALYLLYAAYGIAQGALDMLMDKELPTAEREKISQIALSHPQVHRVSDLRTRAAGNDIFVEVTLRMSGILTLVQAQDIADIITFKIRQQYPSAEVRIRKLPWTELEPIPRMPPVRPSVFREKK
jgi:ferrous-iron efflux pump FieF